MDSCLVGRENTDTREEEDGRDQQVTEIASDHASDQEPRVCGVKSFTDVVGRGRQSLSGSHTKWEKSQLRIEGLSDPDLADIQGSHLSYFAHVCQCYPNQALVTSSLSR